MSPGDTSEVFGQMKTPTTYLSGDKQRKVGK